MTRSECSGRRRKHGTCFHTEESTMTQTVQHPHNQPWSQPSISVIAIDTQEHLPDDGVFIDVVVEAAWQTLQPAYRGDTVPMPTIALGALVLFFNGVQCTHAGIVNFISEKPGLRDFSVATWPLSATVLVPERYFDRSVKRGDLIAKQCVRYQGKAQVDQEAFACTVARVPQELAVDLRARIGLQVDERLQKIYWNEDELARLQRERDEVERFANALQEELEAINAQ